MAERKLREISDEEEIWLTIRSVLTFTRVAACVCAGVCAGVHGRVRWVCSMGNSVRRRRVV